VPDPVRPSERIRVRSLTREEETDPKHYIADPDLTSAVNVALLLDQPLLLTGESGTGKTQLAYSLAYQLKYEPLLKYATRSNSTASDLFYTYNALAEFHSAQLGARMKVPSESLTQKNVRELGLDYIQYNALGEAILRANSREDVQHLLPKDFQHAGHPERSIVLIDEIDKAPRDFPNDLLDALDEMRFQIPELDNQTVQAPKAMRPILVITSNLEKDLPDAFLRRCVYHNIELPRKEEELKAHLKTIVLARLGGLDLLDDALALFIRLRQNPNLRKPPSTAELLAWLRILREMKGPRQGNPLRGPGAKDCARTSLGCLFKLPEDLDVGRKVVDLWEPPKS
jgi:MoxR-like ATPase